jgi:hypothetical protein
MVSCAARNITIGLVALLLLLSWGTAEAQVQPASAEVTRMTGRVEVLPKGTQNWAAATVGTRLVEGDQVRALQGASAELNLPDGSTILVAENTRFAVTRLAYDPQTRDRNSSFYLAAGKVRAQVSHTAVQLARQRQSNFTISTPSGVAAVRGTIAVVAHNPTTGETLVFALPSPGQAPAAARVTYIGRSGQPPVTITGGQYTRQTGTGAPSAPQPISTLSPAAQAAITNAANGTTAGIPELTGFNVTVIQADADIVLVQTATGVAVVTPTQVNTLGTSSSSTGVSTIGQDILNNSKPQGPTCVPSTSTTCP